VRRRVKVRGWQVQESDPRLAQRFLVVAILGTKIDNRGDSMRGGQLWRLLTRKSGPERELLRQPMKVVPVHLRPFRLIFIFFFIIPFCHRSVSQYYCCSFKLYCCFIVQRGNNKAS